MMAIVLYHLVMLFSQEFAYLAVGYDGLLSL